VYGTLRRSRTAGHDGSQQPSRPARRPQCGGSKQFLDDVADQHYLGAIATMKKALLVCHAPHDDVVGIENASEIFAAAGHPKSFLSLDSADHLLWRREDAIYVADVISAWVSRYLPARDAVGEEPLAVGQVIVSETRTGRCTQASFLL
jgi:hypothetical protein